MTNHAWRWGGAALVLVAAACGGKTDDLTDGGGADGGGDSAPSTDCPATVPSDGSACSKSGLKCEYGVDDRWTCNTITSCAQGRWSATPSSDPTCPTPAVNPQACPASFAAVPQGQACAPMYTACEYPQGWCACTYTGGPPMQDAGGPTTIWDCATTQLAGCPSSRPRIGTTCSHANLECDYAVCGAPEGLSVLCNGATGTWVDGLGAPCAGAN